MIPIIVKLLPVFAIPPKLRTLNFILWIFILDLCYPLTDFLWTSLVAQMVGIYLYCRRSRFDPWVGKIPLEKGMATLSSILAWRIPWTEEPGWLQSMGLQRVRHDWAINTFTWLLFYTYCQLSWILCSQQEQSSFCFCSHPNSFHSFSTQINYFLFLKKLALDLCLHWPISKFCSCDCYLTSRWQITWEW